MRAIVVRQPWASLIAHGIKTIETRGFQPRTTLAPGDQLAIVAGKAEPKVAPDPMDESDDGSGWWLGDYIRVCDERPTGEGWWLERWVGTDADLTEPLPLGAVVAVVTFEEALRVAQGPVTSWPDSGRQFVYWPHGTERGLNPEADQLLRLDRGNGFDTWSGQLPLGDFTPGRFGWLLSNPQRIDPVPCPAIAPDGTRTVTQGVFTLPDDVAAAVTAQLGTPS